MRVGRAPLLAAAIVLSNVLILWSFHDRFWYAVDEGNYAHVADRVLAGEVLNRDVQDIHLGSINFVNVAAFRAFGVNLLSLRYPLMLAALVQACLVARLLAARGTVTAAVGSVATIVLGVIQFLNPTAHWYCLSLTVVLVCWLSWTPVHHWARIAGAGVLVGTIVSFRQLTGVWVAMATIVLLLEERSSDAKGSQLLVARATLAGLLALVVFYVTSTARVKPGGLVLIAVWPIALLGVALWRTTVGNRAAMAVLAHLALGAVLAAIPLVSYHVAHGSVSSWMSDTVRAAGALTTLGFFEGLDLFGVMPLLGLNGVAKGGTMTMIVNGFYWMVLPLIPLLVGSMTVLHACRRGVASQYLPVTATFYALVSLHFDIPIYLYYTLGLSAAALLWMTSPAVPRIRTWCVATVAGLVAVAIVYHAGQSSSRTLRQVVAGERTWTPETRACEPFSRSTLRVEVQDCEVYHRLVRLIEAEVPAGQPIFAVPSDAELYFLANRPNPFRFFNSALGILDQHDLTAVLDTLARTPPRIVTFRPDDKYNTTASHRIMEAVRASYDLLDKVGDMEVYRRRQSGMEGDRP